MNINTNDIAKHYDTCYFFFDYFYNGYVVYVGVREIINFRMKVIESSTSLVLVKSYEHFSTLLFSDKTNKKKRKIAKNGTWNAHLLPLVLLLLLPFTTQTCSEKD